MLCRSSRCVLTLKFCVVYTVGACIGLTGYLIYSANLLSCSFIYRLWKFLAAIGLFLTGEFYTG